MTAPMAEQVVQPSAVEPSTVVRVLVVDDTPTLRMLTRLALSGTGFEVIGEASDGQEGIEQAILLQPDLVLLDLAMPVMDGLEALPLMRQALPNGRVVIVSGFDRRAMEDQVIAAGAHAYLQKGLTPQAIVAELRRLFPFAQADQTARQFGRLRTVCVDAELHEIQVGLANNADALDLSQVVGAQVLRPHEFDFADAESVRKRDAPAPASPGSRRV